MKKQLVEKFLPSGWLLIVPAGGTLLTVDEKTEDCGSDLLSKPSRCDKGIVDMRLLFRDFEISLN